MKRHRREIEKAEAFIERVRRMLAYDIVVHEHHGKTHRHAWGSMKHSHMMRAVCGREECEGFPTHDIHPSPADQPA